MNPTPRVIQVQVPQHLQYQQVVNHTPSAVQQPPIRYVVVQPQNAANQTPTRIIAPQQVPSVIQRPPYTAQQAQLPQQVVTVMQVPQSGAQPQRIGVNPITGVAGSSNTNRQQKTPTTTVTQTERDLQPFQSPQNSNAVNTLPNNIEPFHVFKPLDPSTEHQIKYVKWTLNFRVLYFITMLCLGLWLYLLIKTTINHYQKTGTLKWGYCDSSASYYSCHDDDYEILCDLYCEDSDGTGWIHPCWDEPGDNCEPFNNTSYGVLVARILLVPIIAYFLYKLFKSVFQGIKLPKLEDSKKSFGDKIYDKKFDLRPMIDTIHSRMVLSSDSVSNNDTSEHGGFVHFIWTASFVLFFMKMLCRDFPVIVLNLLSSSSDLHVIAWVMAAVDGFTLAMMFLLRNSCDLQNGCRTGNDLNYYPVKNLKFIPVMTSRMVLFAVNFSMGIIQASMTTRSSSEGAYDIVLRSVNFIMGIYRMVGYCGSFFSLAFKFHFYWQKEFASKRESLLLRDLIRSLFSWLIFKVMIHDDDKYVYVNEKQASSQVLKCDPRSGYGKAYFPWLLAVSGAIVYGMMLMLSLIFQ